MPWPKTKLTPANILETPYYVPPFGAGTESVSLEDNDRKQGGDPSRRERGYTSRSAARAEEAGRNWCKSHSSPGDTKARIHLGPGESINQNWQQNTKLVVGEIWFDQQIWCRCRRWWWGILSWYLYNCVFCLSLCANLYLVLQLFHTFHHDQWSSVKIQRQIL